MDKMRMESPDMTAQNVDRIAALFPNCVTEVLDEEHSTPEKKVYKRAINFELLKQMLSPDVVNIINLRLDITHLYYPAKNSFQKGRLKRREIFTELLLYTLTT